MENRPRLLPPRRRRRQTLPPWALGGLLVLFVVAIAFAGYLIYAGVRDFVAELDLNQEPEIGAGAGHDPQATAGGQPSGEAPVVEVPPGSTPIPPPVWTGTERVTLLVTGIDQREIETGPSHTDSILLVSIDPVSRTASMLSIPRDLQVEIPLDQEMGDCDEHSINEANFWGDVYDYPGGGSALAVKTVSQNFGISIDHYLRLNFVAFETLIDQIGGIDVEVAETIDDPLYPDLGYGYEPFFIQAGLQHLNGHEALRYARTRATTGGDFDRAARQQQVALAIRDQALNTDALPSLLAQAPQLYRTLSGSYETDMTLEEMLSLAWLAADIPRQNIRSAIINQDYLTSEYISCSGHALLAPDLYKIGTELIEPMFLAQLPAAAARTAAPAPTVVGATEDPNQTANARVSVQNGSNAVGVAWETREYLVGQGFNVVEVGNAERLDYATTVLIDYTGQPLAIRTLAEALGVPVNNIYSGSDPGSDIDVRVIIGADFVLPGG